MARVKGGSVTRRRHKKVLKLARGYRGAKSKVYRVAHQQVMKSLNYAYIHRRLRKRDFRKLWITRINAGARNHGLSYSKFVNGLKKAGVGVNRKMLADLAVNNDAAFGELVKLAKQNL
ncbi:MAG: 50S ribosomal protein L20 [Syntrophaceticus sp.]|jgi:large subunit ribosomal protein L20|nr:50S ribosomal protein L20 [Syntrophaceticus sp.]MDD3314657.1 50S ribosomal protein L20 [Syntrophaceticus sp.]MDD4359892.1 50S ribosomal protein L20 [Syntrophaceticus sp.]MDD4782867.1 50S ribosomal protein L20 [Syntrophaceticus sp.]HBG23068.1 50S ribosomal protein L20 [Peptococcaceae bacterium]